MGRLTRRVTARRLSVGEQVVVAGRLRESLAVEEPLQIRIDDQDLAVTMRTPGHDFELVLGWLFAEGFIAGADDVRHLVHCRDTDAAGRPTFNTVDVTSTAGIVVAAPVRAAVVSGACGICGSHSIEEIDRASRYDLRENDTRLDPRILVTLPERLRARQRVFLRSGGTHAAGLATSSGELLVVREDVGRHNAVDKVIGWAITQNRVPLRGCVLVVSGRAGFELVQKAVLAGIPAMVAVSAASTLAVDLAAQAGLTLAAFTRDPRLTVYTGMERLGPLE